MLETRISSFSHNALLLEQRTITNIWTMDKTSPVKKIWDLSKLKSLDLYKTIVTKIE